MQIAVYGKTTFRKITRTGKELRDLFEHAEVYLQGGGSTISMYGYADIARSVATHPDVLELLDEWATMAEPAWNEWGIVDDPISEDEFREWISKQLVHTETIPYPSKM